MLRMGTRETALSSFENRGDTAILLMAGLPRSDLGRTCVIALRSSDSRLDGYANWPDEFGAIQGSQGSWEDSGKTRISADCRVSRRLTKNARAEFNKALMKVIGLTPEPRPTTSICSSAAIWSTTFSKAVKESFGDEAWDGAFLDARTEYSIPAEQAQKRFAVVWRTIDILETRKLQFNRLEDLWKAMTVFFGIELEAYGVRVLPSGGSE